MTSQIVVTCPCCGTHFVVTRELLAPTPRRTRDPDDKLERVHYHPNDDLEERRGYHGPARRFVDPHDPDGGEDDVRCPNRGRLIRGR